MGSEERSLHHADLSVWTGILFVDWESASICTPFYRFSDSLVIIFLEFDVRGIGGEMIASCILVGVDRHPLCGFGDCFYLQTVLEILG